MNLCTNSAYAMEENGGILELSLTTKEINTDLTSQILDIETGSYLRLTVSDTGVGMTPEVMRRIFEPYFTTKEKGCGTGLGLAVVHGIIHGYGGTIRVYSEPGEGTTFHVYLPLIQEEERHGKESEGPIPCGNERVLFVDDEKILTEMGEQMLEYMGYEVVTRTSAVEALELFRARPDQFDLVITDMTMTKMTGEKLAKELLNIRPDIPIILFTGYSRHISEEKVRGMGISAFVMKPIIMRDLANVIREALDKKR